MLRRSRTAVLAVLLTLVLAACGGAGDETGAQQATGAPSTEPVQQAFPVTIEAENGPVVLEEQPERIVSLSPTATESLFAVGAGDKIVAVDDQSTYPAEAPRTDLSGFQPNIEAIAGYEPDLVVAGFDPGGLVDGLEKVGVRVLLQPAATALADAYEQVEELGAATGNVEEAEEVVESMRSRIDELTASASEAARGLTVYHEVSPDFFSATSQTFIGSVYELFGLVNIADAAADADATGYPQLTGEYIVSESPDLIVLADTRCCDQTAATVSGRPGWDQIEAVQNGDIVEADDDIASRWGPRTVVFVEQIAESLAGIGRP